MVVDPVLGSVKEVAKLVLEVKAAADAVRHNKDACVELTNMVDLLGAIIAPLEDLEMSKKPVMRAALTSLEIALRRGHKLVTACQRERNFIDILFKAKGLSRKLLKVKDDITHQMLIANFALNANTHVLITIVHGRLFQTSLDPPPPLQGIGLLDSSNISGESYSANYVGIHIVQGNGDAPSLSPLRIFDPVELEVATNNFSEENVIGNGTRATIYKGALAEELVAIRRYPDQSGPQRIQQYINAFQLLIEHENVVKFLGFCHVDGSEMVVEEYIPNGSLFDIINGSSQKLDWFSTFQVIRGIALGVAYLHSKHVIHLDLNPANVVLDYNMNPKISNFEVSKLLDKNDPEAGSLDLVGTLGYMSPEYITDGTIAMPSDVFGFGVLLIHSISAMRSSILEQHPITWAWEVREAKGMKGLLDSSWGNEQQLEEIKRCMEIGLLCTQEFPKDRPTMLDVVEFLNGNQMLPTPKKPCFI